MRVMKGKDLKSELKAKEEIEWQESMRDHEDRVIDLLTSIPKDQLTIRSFPQYTFRCNNCGTTRFFDCREDMQAYKEIHRPKVADKVGNYLGYRTYNCGFHFVMKPSKKRGPISVYTISENIKSEVRKEAGVMDEFSRLWDRVRKVRNDIKSSRLSSEGEYSPSQESEATGGET